MTTPDDKTLDALISELRTYPGLYGDAGAKSADAITALRERIAALEAENVALRQVVAAADAYPFHSERYDALRAALEGKL